MPRPIHRQAQRGSTLLVAMIFLLIFGIMAAATFRGSLTSVQAIGNMQWRNEAINAANDAIDNLLSTANFATDTATVTEGVNKVPYPFRMDANGDDVIDIIVTFPDVARDVGPPRPGPRCNRATPIPAIKLDPDLPADAGCFGSSSAGSSGLGIVKGVGAGGVVQSPSLCANTEWSITVEARDAVTNTNVRVVQGVGVRVLTTDVPICD